VFAGESLAAAVVKGEGCRLAAALDQGPGEGRLVLEVQLVQLVFHKGHVCTCGQLEV